MSLIRYDFDNYMRQIHQEYDPLLPRPRSSILPWTPFDEYFSHHIKPWSETIKSVDRISYDTESKVSVDKDWFEITLDMSAFAPHEITVKTMGNNQVLVEGNYEDRYNSKNRRGSIARHFSKMYYLPIQYNATNVVSDLSGGILTIRAPKWILNDAERNVPISIRRSSWRRPLSWI